MLQQRPGPSGAVNPKRRPEVLPIGYVGREGMYVPGAPLSQALTEHGVHLEFYGAYDQRWNEPWQFFMEHTSINVSLLMPCSESNLGDTKFGVPPASRSST